MVTKNIKKRGSREAGIENDSGKTGMGRERGRTLRENRQ
jgi:hypothetical protein